MSARGHLIALSLSCLAACGGGSQSSPPPQNPVFTSQPVTSASQDTSYSYALAATDQCRGFPSAAEGKSEAVAAVFPSAGGNDIGFRRGRNEGPGGCS